MRNRPCKVTKAIALGVVLLFIVFVITACQSTANTGTILPPAKYDKPHPALFVMRLLPDEVRKLCGSQHSVACSEVGDGVEPCLMIVPDYAPDGGAVWKHERAHCNGWPRHHPR